MGTFKKGFKYTFGDCTHAFNRGTDMKHLCKKIKCLTNGVIYNSLKDASKELNLPLSSISHHLIGKKYYEDVHGYIFERVTE